MAGSDDEDTDAVADKLGDLSVKDRSKDTASSSDSASDKDKSISQPSKETTEDVER